MSKTFTFKKEFSLFSNSGKSVFSTEKEAPCALYQALISYCQVRKDCLKWVENLTLDRTIYFKKSRLVFLEKDPIYGVAIGNANEPVEQVILTDFKFILI